MPSRSPESASNSAVRCRMMSLSQNQCGPTCSGSTVTAPTVSAGCAPAGDAAINATRLATARRNRCGDGPGDRRRRSTTAPYSTHEATRNTPGRLDGLAIRRLRGRATPAGRSSRSRRLACPCARRGDDRGGTGSNRPAPHKLGNILDRLPKRSQPRVQVALHDVMFAERRAQRPRRSRGSPPTTAPSTPTPWRRWLCPP